MTVPRSSWSHLEFEGLREYMSTDKITDEFGNIAQLTHSPISLLAQTMTNTVKQSKHSRSKHSSNL